jgi:hypothetical protein
VEGAQEAALRSVAESDRQPGGDLTRSMVKGYAFGFRLQTFHLGR